MPAPSNSRDTKWADGLRGIASLLVVTAHITRSLAPFLLAPALSEHHAPVIMQLPILRCAVMGRASVAVFAILTGYVNALKPTRQTRAGQVDAALAGIARSAYRRSGRFVIPSLLATTASWLACQLGVYGLGTVVDSAWIRDTSPRPSPSFGAAVRDLLHTVMTTWTNGANEYDKIQWTLTYLLRGSMLVYLALFATAHIRPRFRVFVYLGMMGYYWALGDAVIGINIYAGLLMAELTYYPEFNNFIEERPLTFTLVSPALILLGLLSMSYPEEHPEWTQWSSAMFRLGHYIFPRGAEFARFYPGMGAQLVCFGALVGAPAKRWLSSPWPCFLGRVSFAIYLLHAPLLRTLLTWMLFGLSTRPPSPGVDEHGNPLPQPWVPITSQWGKFFVIPLWYVMLYKIATYWVAFVEPFCGRVTNWIEERIFRDDSKGEKIVSQA